MKKRVIIIHGWEGKPEEHWKPALKAELEKRNFEVLEPAMPDTDNPKIAEWLSCLDKIIGKTNEETFFVGHSLGCPTILHYLLRLQEGEKIGGAVFVAGLPAFSPDISKIKDFYLSEVEVETAKKHRDKFSLIYSDNDKYVSVSEAEKFAEKIGAEKIFEVSKGHFCEEDGVTELPSVLDALLRISDFNYSLSTSH